MVFLFKKTPNVAGVGLYGNLALKYQLYILRNKYQIIIFKKKERVDYLEQRVGQDFRVTLYWSLTKAIHCSRYFFKISLSNKCGQNEAWGRADILPTVELVKTKNFTFECSENIWNYQSNQRGKEQLHYTFDNTYV